MVQLAEYPPNVQKSCIDPQYHTEPGMVAYAYNTKGRLRSFGSSVTTQEV